jgi:catechol 2,3-dioxygenase-like lactoylglutathione lyase family enzyme
MISGLDHVAIPVADMEAMLNFYRQLGFGVDDTLAPVLYAVTFGANKINFHSPGLWQSGKFDLRGPAAKPGCGDFCFVWEGGESELEDLLKGDEIIEGPVERVGGRNQNGCSRYVRDPDGNLLEFIVY